MLEGIPPNAGNAIRNRDARQAATYGERPKSDAGNAIRNRDTRQVGASKEGAPPDAGDRFVLDSHRYNQRARYVSVTASDSGCITHNFIRERLRTFG